MPAIAPPSPALARAFATNRADLALALVDSVSDWDKYAHQIGGPDSRKEFAARETSAFVDYLASYFGTGDRTYRDLYLGEKLKQCYTSKDDPEAAIARRARITQRDREAMMRLLSAHIGRADSELLGAELDSLHALITRPAKNLCRVLLIGDCLYLDLVAFLTAPLLEAGIQLVPSFATSKLQSALRQEIAQHRDRQFDLVFYSPLTYAFHPAYSELQTVRGALRRPASLKALVAGAQRDIESILQLVDGMFECPIFVHNSANLRRQDGTPLELAKTLVTSWARGYCRRLINPWLSECIERVNANSHRHVFLLDETQQLARESERRLSRYIYKTELQHPARFAQAIAPTYEDVIAAQLLLARKKLLVCDLDNTLWKGVIGEGAVEHYRERQDTLRALRQKGFLLAICSKNDPKNVHWRGAVLTEGDFVCGRVNWAPKVANIRHIAAQLNLKTKDFIFIDDRADERELVSQALPEIAVLDADSPSTWSRLAVIADTTTEGADGDRTQAYFDRETRQRFLMEEAPESTLTSKLGAALEAGYDQAEKEALAKLELRLSVRRATPKDLKRVSELINRTNQFNLCGSRTTLREVTEWHKSDRHEILIAEARDKFGSMGVISVAVLEESDRGVEIPVFVLSCRVFGYGMETALVNCMRGWRPGRSLHGHFRETAHNQPCHNVYPQNGFTWDGACWRSTGEHVAPDPSWLAIENEELRARTANV